MAAEAKRSVRGSYAPGSWRRYSAQNTNVPTEAAPITKRYANNDDDEEDPGGMRRGVTRPGIGAGGVWDKRRGLWRPGLGPGAGGEPLAPGWRFCARGRVHRDFE